jgi:hypothetical protein
MVTLQNARRFTGCRRNYDEDPLFYVGSKALSSGWRGFHWLGGALRHYARCGKMSLSHSAASLYCSPFEKRCLLRLKPN